MDKKNKLKCPKCGTVISNPISVAGGRKSRREISPEQQAKMQEARRKKRK